ncbi:MAG: class II fructose-bisphosphate aldolase [Patescibacteria group bacterium]|nr:class II fructose-bisphosphate aldolase [Patescibacteria group bacterium]
MNLKDYILEAEQKEVAIGHFNISDMAGLKGIFEAARFLNLPIVIGLSEGEAEFFGYKQAGAIVRSLREQYDYPIFLNADHTKSLEKIKEAVKAGFDAVLFDAGKLPFEENIQKTKEVVEYAKSANPNILVEAELGYLGASSVILKEIPKDAAINKEDLTKPEEAKRFVEETEIDLLAPAVGNIHGMFKNAPNPNLDIERIKQLREAADIPLVLHGGSGITDDNFIKAIEAGILIIHINTEIRLAWREGLNKAFSEKPEEIVPYKLLPYAVDAIKNMTEKRLRLFNKL